MSEINRIQDQLRRSVRGEAWHGQSLLELLRGVSADDAAAHPVPGAHSIWELALHVEAWLSTVERRVRGRQVELSEAEDWPAVADRSMASWAEVVRRLDESAAALEGSVGALSEKDLTRTAPGRTHDLYFLLHGVIQHTLYHAGQIALLRKALSSGVGSPGER